MAGARWRAGASRRSRAIGDDVGSSGSSDEELHHVVEAEAAIAPLADAIEGQLAPIAETLHRVDVEVQHVRDLARGEHRPELVGDHRCHWSLSLVFKRLPAVSVPVRRRRVDSGRLLMGA